MKKDLGQLLVEKGLIKKEQLTEACNVLAEKGGVLSELLVDLGFVQERDLMIFFSTYLSIPPIKVLNLKISPEILDLVPREIARKHMVLPVGKVGNTLTVAVADPLNVILADDMERVTGCKISPVIALRSELRQAMELHYKESMTSAIEEIIKDSDGTTLEFIKSEEEKDQVRDEDILRSIEDAPIIKMTNFILKKAVDERASDVMIEPMLASGRVRLRQDGVLREIQVFPKKMHPFIISRVKVIANLNITEHRLPQDGRFRMSISGNDVDFRVSIMPATSGERAVLRVLDRSAGLKKLDDLGFEENLSGVIKNDIVSSFGMVLVCGPTGCGKTTSLYSLLNYIYSPEKNIVTVEDPIEYQLEGVSQVNVNYEVNLTFAATLRSILRQDPDVIMVGEIRDFDTVDIAIKAALTGHLVLSTLHTTTACGSVTRLVNMGVEPFLLSSTLIGVLAQRLVRKLCPRCRQVNDLSQELRLKYHVPPDITLYKPKGCPACNNFGYRGRMALIEYLHLVPEIKATINQGANEHVIKRLARSLGMRTLREDGMAKVAQGLTSLEEVINVTAADEE